MLNAQNKPKLSSDSIKKFKNESHASSSIDQGIESGFSSHIELTNNSADFSLPPVKPALARRQVSFAKRKSLDLADRQNSLGYASLLSTSSGSPQKSYSRSPRKRKADESDENAFYNSYQFVSPLKISKRESSSNRRDAKLILKEKSSSENVMRSSTPIRNSNRNKLWGKYHSYHPEKVQTILSAPNSSSPHDKNSFVLKSAEVSFDLGGSFNITNSFDLSNTNENDKSTIPTNLHQLCTGQIILDGITKPAELPQPKETITKPQEQTDLETSGNSTNTTNSSACSRKIFFNGRSKVNVLGKLFDQNNLALPEILKYMSDVDLLSLSHVSKDYKNMIASFKPLEAKRQNYLKTQRQNLENKLPGSNASVSSKLNTTKNHKRAFGDLNANHSMQLRSKPQSPPVSPSRKRFVENQKVRRLVLHSSEMLIGSFLQVAQTHQGTLKKCPKCCRPAKVKTTSLRTSPRKKKKKNMSILKISTSGRVQKRSKTFLLSPSIDSSSVLSDDLYVTFPMLEEHSDSPSSTSCGSLGSQTSDESCGSGSETPKEAENYEYAECSGIACKFKFCVKCNCRYHPRLQCKDFSPVSPPRGQMNKSAVACSRASVKSLKRLIY